ncbi:MAG: sigma-70 family RNA polymerase sigma factor [Planctomycetota bacterium]
MSILQNTEESRQINLRHYAQFVREHETNILTYVFRMVNNREDAEDITQTALLQAWETWNKIDPELGGGYAKWCYRIAHNLAVDLLRKKKPRATDDEEIEHTADARSLKPEDIYEHRAQSGWIRECLLSLDEKYREVLILRYQEEMSYEKIAEILELPISTIETRIFRAKKMLRKKLEQEH